MKYHYLNNFANDFHLMYFLFVHKSSSEHKPNDTGSARHCNRFANLKHYRIATYLPQFKKCFQSSVCIQYSYYVYECVE
jgi:hypothetical protein